MPPIENLYVILPYFSLGEKIIRNTRPEVQKSDDTVVITFLLSFTYFFLFSKQIRNQDAYFI